MTIAMQQKKLAAVIAGLFILNAGFLIFITLPLLRHIFESRATIAQAEQQIAILDEERTHFLALERRITQEANVFQRIEKTTLSLSEPLSFIELIETLAKEQGLQARLLVRNAAAHEFQNFQIIAEGDFPHIYQYLRILELMPYQATFSGFHLEFFEQGSSEVVIKNKSVALGSAKKPVISRLTLDLAIRTK